MLTQNMGCTFQPILRSQNDGIFRLLLIKFKNALFLCIFYEGAEKMYSKRCILYIKLHIGFLLTLDLFFARESLL